MQKYKMTRLAAYMVVAVGLAACGANGGGDGTNNNGGNPNGPGNTCTPNSGLICTVQNVVDQATNGTPLAPVQELIDGLLDPNSGGLAALTGPLDEITGNAAALGQLNDIVNQLVGENNSALTPLIVALNGVLGGAGGTGGNGPIPGVPALDASALCALPGIGPQLASAAGSTCGGAGGGSPVDASQLCAIPVLGPQLAGAAGASCGGTGAGGSGDASGLIATVQDTVNGLVGTTGLQPVSDLVNTLVDPQSGALGALTSQLDAVTSDPEALAALNQLVEALVGENNSALTPLINQLNSILGGAGGAGAVPTPDDLLGQLPANPLTDALCGLLGC